MWQNNRMITIGITGGVGAGKSTVLQYLQEHCNCKILLTDRMAEELQMPGTPLYGEILALLEEACEAFRAEDPEGYVQALGNMLADGKPLLTGQEDRINRKLMAALIFRDPALLERVNALVHPAVLRQIDEEKESARCMAEPPEIFVVESALMIESGLADNFDSVWYIYCLKEIRRERLRISRGYTDARIDAIMDAQLPDSVFRERCDVVIDNSGDPDYTCQQTEAALKALREKIRTHR